MDRAAGHGLFLWRKYIRENWGLRRARWKSRNCRRGSPRSPDARSSWDASWVHRWKCGRRRSRRIFARPLPETAHERRTVPPVSEPEEWKSRRRREEKRTQRRRARRGFAELTERIGVRSASFACLRK